MTPKEKAWDLNQKFMELQHYLENNAWNNSKQCALIAVDEILDTWLEFSTDRIFWQEVKHEIEAL
jgi:hypothetical protein